MIEIHENTVLAKDIDLDRGFSWDDNKKKLWIDLSALVDNDTIMLNPVTGKFIVNPVKLNAFKEYVENALNQLNRDVNSFKTDITNDFNTFKNDINNKANQIEQTVNNFIENIKQNGVAIKTDPESIITGKGTTTEPLSIDLNKLLQLLGSHNLLGEGIELRNGKLNVKTESITDASGTTHEFWAVVK